LLRVGPPLAPHQLKIGDPVVVVEVLSPSTAHTDTSAKLIGYFRVPSVHHYLVVDPDARSVTHHARSAQGAIEARTLASGPLMLDPPGIAFDIADLFG
jgi:Uma2 family endonuclease